MCSTCKRTACSISVQSRSRAPSLVDARHAFSQRPRFSMSDSPPLCALLVRWPIAMNKYQTKWLLN
eukprot:5789920-Pleurochrysis_carterae.AAC.5